MCVEGAAVMEVRLKHLVCWYVAHFLCQAKTKLNHKFITLRNEREMFQTEKLPRGYWLHGKESQTYQIYVRSGRPPGR